ncbi:MAG TPA: carboxypeptidase-like regulatory domain-containing protein [Longimicrobiaceae bacterium]|nr:carboxypeptidase-like regulatory domain-containing protein [Longimicrobiaceae bacterium]
MIRVATQSAGLLTLLLFALVSTVAAQLAGRVRGEDGRPVAGATLRLTIGGEAAGSTRTDAQGLFHIARPQRAGDVVLAVSADGYSPTQLPVSAADSVFVIRLRSSVVQLAPVMARRERVACEGREHPDARAVWQAASARVPAGLDSVHFRSPISGVMRILAPDSLHRVPLDTFAITGEADSDWWARVGWRRQIAAWGYARGLTGSHSDQFGAWEYAPLWEADASHFLEPGFGGRHTLEILTQRGDTTTIRFCPRHVPRQQATIQGTLRFVAGNLVHAEWQFTTRAPDEMAGGWVALAPTTAEVPLLLPAESFYYRRKGNGQYYELRTHYEPWHRFAQPPRATRTPPKQ